MPDVTVTSDIDAFLKSSNNSTARTNLGAESAPTSIANKEAAYALTGVAAGTVYKTEDTGQVMEFIGTDETSIYDWKMDGVIWVDENSDKQLLTNLPDGQQVEIVGEGGRLERFNGDNAGFLTSFTVAGDGIDFDGYEVAGVWYENSGGGDYWGSLTGSNAASFRHNGSRWELTGGPFTSFYSADCDADVPIWEATGWTTDQAQSGTIDSITIAPEATASNWFTLKNTVYLSGLDADEWGAFILNGVTVPEGGSVGQAVGWVPVCEEISVNKAAGGDYRFRVREINGENSYSSNSGTVNKLYPVFTDYAVTLPDVFPAGASVTIATYS